jgi:chloramphenicol O-acetyltransferase
LVKYKRLTLTELKLLEKQFIQYLAFNSISAKDWEKMKTCDLDKVEAVIDDFSDFIYESTLTKIEYLVLKQKNSLNCIKVNENDFDQYILTSKTESINFESFNQEMLNEKHTNINVFYLKRNTNNLTATLLQLIEQGAEIVDESLYLYLKQLT